MKDYLEKETNVILNEIQKNNLQMDEFINPDPFTELLYKRMDSLNVKAIDIIKKVNLDPQNGYKYLKGQKKINRDLALKLFVSLDYNLDEIQQYLKLYQYPVLYPKLKRDYLIIQAISNNENIAQINKRLQEHGEFLI